MDHAAEILTELKGLRVDITRALTKLEEVEKREAAFAAKQGEMDGRLRALESSQSAKLASAGLGSGGLVAIIQWLLSNVGG